MSRIRATKKNSYRRLSQSIALPPRIRHALAQGKCIFKTFGFVWVHLIAGGSLLVAQPAVRDGPFSHQVDLSLRAEKDLVLVPVSVIDQKGRPVIGLRQGNFRVFDDRKEKRIESFSMVDEPTAVGIVFDTSRSMSRVLGYSRMAAKAFLESSNPADDFLLVEFNSQPTLSVPLTNDVAMIQAKLAATEAKGHTAALDAIYFGVSKIEKSGKRRKALLVISDGNDNHSRYREREVERLLRESDVLIYAVGISDYDKTGLELLDRIAEQTGGRAYYAPEKELVDIAKQISVQLRNQYILGFSPEGRFHDGRYHLLQVRMVRTHGLPPLFPACRLGYYATSEQ